MDENPKRQEITAAAYQLFIDKGYHGTSMRQIAACSGIALGGVYNHFASKEELFEAVLTAYHPYVEILPALKQAQGDTVEALIRAAARAMLDSLKGRPAFLNLMFIELVEFNGVHTRRLFELIYPQVAEFVVRLNRVSGGLRQIPLPTFMRAFIGLFFSYYITEKLLNSPIAQQIYPGDKTFDEFVDILLYGIVEA
jgi:AcrR family transcriptional regulator